MACTQYDIRNTQYATRNTLNAIPYTLSPIFRLINQLTSSPVNLLHRARKYNKNMQNEPNFKIAGNDISTCNTNTYGNIIAFSRPKNEPKRTQNEPNFSPKLALFSSNEPNFKPNYVKIGNLKGKTLTRNADFFDEPESKFRAMREEAFEWLNLAESGPAVFVFFHTGTAGIIIEFAVNIIKGVFATAGWAIRINRTQIIFKEAAGAIF